MPGPAPSPEGARRRRNATLPMTQLPAEGRPGKPPPWPLSSQPSCLWLELWSLPQAVMWERQRLDRVVARYCRVLDAAEAVDAPVSLLGEVRQLEDRLGLSPMAMSRLRWEVAPDEVAERRGQQIPPTATAPRRVLRVAGGGD
jgi:hypothetical protein